MKFEEIWPREKSFKGVDGRTMDGRQTLTGNGRQVITIAHPEHCSGELRRQHKKTGCHRPTML